MGEIVNTQQKLLITVDKKSVFWKWHKTKAKIPSPALQAMVSPKYRKPLLWNRSTPDVGVHEPTVLTLNTSPIPSLPFLPHYSCLVPSFLLLYLVSSGPAMWLCLKVTARKKFHDTAWFFFWAYKIEWGRIENTAHSSFKTGKRRNRRNKSINIFLCFSLLCSTPELFIHPGSEDPQPLPLPNSCLSFTSTASCQPPDHSRTGNHSTQISVPLHHDSCLSL